MGRRLSLPALGTFFAGLCLVGVVPAVAQAPVAVVEDVTGKSAGVEFMDYVPAGKVIRLGPADALVLNYMKSCWREEITGGVITTGLEQSDVKDGKVRRTKVECDGGKMQLTAQQASKSGAMVFRSGPKATPTAGGLPSPQLTLYGLSPVVDIKGGGRLVIERLDQPADKIDVTVADHQLFRGALFDFAKDNKELVAGGLYKASVGTNQIVFKVDPYARPGEAPLLSRLLRFVPAS
jgi:hypothetical protein